MKDPKEGAAEIMKQYALVASEVEYDKNLEEHYSDISLAIKEINSKIDAALLARNEIPSYYVVAWHLYLLRDDIVQRIANLR